MYVHQPVPTRISNLRPCRIKSSSLPVLVITLRPKFLLRGHAKDPSLHGGSHGGAHGMADPRMLDCYFKSAAAVSGDP